jgi:hypothetical protein
MDSVSSIKIPMSEVFGKKRASSMVHVKRRKQEAPTKTSEKMRQIKPPSISRLPPNTRISYTFRTASKTITITSAFFKQIVGKKSEYALVRCGKQTRPILIANILTLHVDIASITKEAKQESETSKLVKSMLSIEAKLNLLLNRK